MKYAIILVSLVLFVFAGILPVTGNDPVAQKENGAKAAEQPTWEIPIAAGVWYPTDGAVPEKPMRYYRIRCWPGCHSGSSLGKYPHKALNDKPIWPTTTINMHTTESSGQQ
ncbi:MAG: hypothetical protein JRH18_21795 [Deltaproteobacteria bacterium]|nr:hypothetical protein [Deltaproteobacteria bacterium]MBW2154285.1 hypothetical protein [Deltaproteobacteria bacterium]